MIFSFGKSSKSSNGGVNGADLYTDWQAGVEEGQESYLVKSWQEIPLKTRARKDDETFARWRELSAKLKNKAAQDKNPQTFNSSNEEPSPSDGKTICLTDLQIVNDGNEKDVVCRPSWPEDSQRELNLNIPASNPVPVSPVPIQTPEISLPKTPAEPKQLRWPNRILPHDPSLGLEEDFKRRFGSNIRSALGPGTVIEGTFSFDSPVCIEGTLSGEVCSSSVLIVGSQAVVNSTIRVGSLIVLGYVSGNVEASDLVEIRAEGRLEGDIITSRLVIEENGFFQGKCAMRSSE